MSVSARMPACFSRCCCPASSCVADGGSRRCWFSRCCHGVLPAQTAFISFHWMMIYWGFLNSLLEMGFGIAGPDWLDHYWLALGANIIAYTWKTMPLLTLIFLAGRIALPQGLYDAADIDRATGF